jgi:hypothetical protein
MTQRFSAENLSAAHLPNRGVATHPHPTPAQARERSHLRHAADDRTQRFIWRAFFIGLGLLFAVGVAAGLRQRGSTGEALPQSPPGQR